MSLSINISQWQWHSFFLLLRIVVFLVFIMACASVRVLFSPPSQEDLSAIMSGGMAQNTKVEVIEIEEEVEIDNSKKGN